MILYSLVVILYNKILKRNYNKIQYLEADKNSKLVESIASLDTINGLKIQKFISKKFEYVYIKYLKIAKLPFKCESAKFCKLSTLPQGLQGIWSYFYPRVLKLF